MAISQRDVRNRIASVRNIQTITRAMEMVAAARLRRAEQRIDALRPYADAIRRMTREAAEAAGAVPNLPILSEHVMGQLMQMLMLATVVEGRLLGVNPYGQPGVDAYKRNVQAILKAPPTPS